jgi:hypothetical protein
VLAEINFEELTETKIEPHYEAWLALPESPNSPKFLPLDKSSIR